jgi:hypothetical protein
VLHALALVGALLLGALKASLLLSLRLRVFSIAEPTKTNCLSSLHGALLLGAIKARVCVRACACLSCVWQYAQALLGVLLLGALKAQDGACKDGACKDGACNHGACVTGRYVARSEQLLELRIIQPRHGEILRKHEAGLGIAFQGSPMPYDDDYYDYDFHCC